MKNNNDDNKENVPNSQKLNGHNSKLIHAKEFYERRNKVKSNISNTTKSNFESLLNQINGALFGSK
ncbi:hypothetical protein J2746_000757 [Methanolobus bombayensis]|nr:hypothetical protein [Methanolobus bombayensis]